MIVYDLICDKEHGFQGWFSDSLSCEEQLTDKKVSCPECGSLKVQKTLMSPNLNKKSRKSRVIRNHYRLLDTTETTSGSAKYYCFAK